MNKSAEQLLSLSKQIEACRWTEDRANLDPPFSLQFLHELEALCLSVRSSISESRITDIGDMTHAQEEAWKSFGYGIAKEGNTTHLVLPPILPEHERYSGKGRKYISVVLREFIISALKGQPVTRYKQCVLVFEHQRQTAKKFDYDNLEYKTYQDAISDIFLEGDSINCLSLYQCFRLGEQNQTNVFIVKPEEFSAWIEEKMCRL